MLLVTINYQWELINSDFLNKKDVETKYINEPKWQLYSHKLLKILAESKDKFNMLINYWTCWTKNKEDVGEIFHVDRTFLYHKDIIDSQKFTFPKIWFNIKKDSIVSKFFVWWHDNKLYDFSDRFDIESYWLALLSSQINIPIINIKAITDTNDIYSDTQEIQNLLNNNLDIKDKIKQEIPNLSEKFKNLFENELYPFYTNYSSDSKFRKQIIT
jgi:hypothetical protein